MKSDEEDKVFPSVGSLTSNKRRRREKMKKGRSLRKLKKKLIPRSTSETRREWKKRKGEVFDSFDAREGVSRN